MVKTIRPDGSLDPESDFADDGASFRVRRDAYLSRRRPRNMRQAAIQGGRIVLWLWITLLSLFVGVILGGIICCFSGL
jgi:hypothetical protein